MKEDGKMEVRHKKYGPGRLISFDPLAYMVIDFSRNGGCSPMMISTTKEHLEEVILEDGLNLLQIVDLQDPRWYSRWRLRSCLSVN